MAYLMIHNKGNDTVDNKTKELLKEGINLMREIKNKVCKGVDNCEICPFFNVDSAGWCHCEFNIMQSMNNYRNGLTKIEPLTKEKIKEVQDFHLEAQGLTKEETESTEKDSELKKYVNAIYKAEKLLFDAEFELSKVLRDECWMNDEEKGILLDFMKCYLRTKKYNYDNVEVSVMMRLGGCKNADEAKEKYYE